MLASLLTAPHVPATSLGGTGPQPVAPPGVDLQADDPVASVDGKTLTYRELLEEAKVDLQQHANEHQTELKQLETDYRRTQHQVIEDQLTKLLNRRVLALEAAARNTTELEVLKDVKTPEVSEAEVRQLFEAHQAETHDSFEKVAPQLREGLMEQKKRSALDAFYVGLRTKYGAQGHLEPLRDVVEAKGPTRGPADAAVTLVEFADFQCPYCRREHLILQAILKRYPHQVRLVYRHLPLSDLHPQAMHAAQAAVCSDKQGRFWEMHDTLFTQEGDLSDASLEAAATSVGLDKKRFDECVRSLDVNKVIYADLHAAQELSLRGTPALFINGRFVSGARSEEQLAAIIDEELQQPFPGKTLGAAR